MMTPEPAEPASVPRLPRAAAHSAPPCARGRRAFLRESLRAAPALALAGTAARGAAPVPGDDPPVIDYGRSFLQNTAAFNSVRMWIESRTWITDPRSGTRSVFLQGASCKSEHTFAERNLFHQDNYDFLPVFGDGRVLVFRRHHHERPGRYRTVKRMEEMWGGNPVVLTPAAKSVTELTTFEAIRDATAAGAPLVTRTELRDPGTGLTAVIECPCKTMNLSEPQRKYQVDTGPVVFPDLSRRPGVPIDCLSLAYLAFNAPQFTDFVIEAPTPVLDAGRTVAVVHHYSRLLSLPARNRVFAIGL